MHDVELDPERVVVRDAPGDRVAGNAGKRVREEVEAARLARVGQRGEQVDRWVRLSVGEPATWSWECLLPSLSKIVRGTSLSSAGGHNPVETKTSNNALSRRSRLTSPSTSRFWLKSRGRPELDGWCLDHPQP